MTDNTPRPEPMNRENVLAVLDDCIKACEEYAHLLPDNPRLVGLKNTRYAIAALYVRCEALERAVERKNQALHNYLHMTWISVVQQYGVAPTESSVRKSTKFARKAFGYTGVEDIDWTEASDAEGGVIAGTNRTTSGAIGQP